jgi:hypothetical protein
MTQMDAENSKDRGTANSIFCGPMVEMALPLLLNPPSALFHEAGSVKGILPVTRSLFHPGSTDSTDYPQISQMHAEFFSSLFHPSPYLRPSASSADNAVVVAIVISLR